MNLYYENDQQYKFIVTNFDDNKFKFIKRTESKFFFYIKIVFISFYKKVYIRIPNIFLARWILAMKFNVYFFEDGIDFLRKKIFYNFFKKKILLCRYYKASNQLLLNDKYDTSKPYLLVMNKLIARSLNDFDDEFQSLSKIIAKNSKIFYSIHPRSDLNVLKIFLNKYQNKFFFFSVPKYQNNNLYNYLLMTSAVSFDLLIDHKPKNLIISAKFRTLLKDFCNENSN